MRLLLGWGSLAGVLGVGASIVLTPFLVGIPCFAGAVGAVTARYARRGFGAPPRLSFAPSVIAGGLYTLALAVGFGLGVGLRGHESLVVALPLVYLLLGWVAAPALFFAVLSLDPRAPWALGERIAVALRLTERVPARQRAAALLVSALALFLPPAIAMESSDELWPLLLVCAGASTYPVIASALLVRTYLRVRPALSEESGALPTAPGHLRVHALLALLLAALAGAAMLVLLVVATATNVTN